MPPSTRPRLRTDHHLERHATWLELFFDLVFAVTVSQLAHRLVVDLHGLADLAAFLGLFAGAWWAWVGHTMFSTRFDSDDATHRVITLFQMLCAAVMAVVAGRHDAESFPLFALAYALLRVGLLAHYARAWRHDPGSRAVSGTLFGWFALGAALSASSAFAPPGSRLAWALWLGGLGVDLVGPILSRRTLGRAPAHGTHLPERFALFTLIVLGESVGAVVRGLAEADLWYLSDLVAILAFVVASCMWWLYFDHMTRTDLRRRLGNGQALLYGHLPLLVALVSLSAGVERAVQESSDASLGDQTTALIFGGAFAWLLAFANIQRVTVPEALRGVRAWTLALAAVATFVLLGTAAWTPPLASLSLLALVFAGLTVLCAVRPPDVAHTSGPGA